MYILYPITHIFTETIIFFTNITIHIKLNTLSCECLGIHPNIFTKMKELMFYIIVNFIITTKMCSKLEKLYFLFLIILLVLHILCIMLIMLLLTYCIGFKR